MSQPQTQPQFVLFDGEIVPYAEARVHVLAPALKYGVAVFEGFCGYWNDDDQELYTFRMRDHLRRLQASIDMAGLDFARDVYELEEDVHRLIRANSYRQNIHMRLQVFLATDDGTPEDSGPTVTSISAVPVRSYFERPLLNLGTSTWRRISDSVMPPRMKSIANYHNGRMASIEAKRNGYDAPLMLNVDGRIAEGFGYNICFVRDGRLATPAVTESILEGITRDAVIRLAREHLGMTVEERPVDRTEIYTVDEAFVCGSAAEVTAVASIDGHVIHDGKVGDVTSSLRQLYLEVAHHERLREWGWTSAVYGADQARPRP
jgi:branched-chain amino acid aminotransferase